MHMHDKESLKATVNINPAADSSRRRSAACLGLSRTYGLLRRSLDCPLHMRRWKRHSKPSHKQSLVYPPSCRPDTNAKRRELEEANIDLLWRTVKSRGHQITPPPLIVHCS